jgi:hypothetical protein
MHIAYLPSPSGALADRLVSYSHGRQTDTFCTVDMAGVRRPLGRGSLAARCAFSVCWDEPPDRHGAAEHAVREETAATVDPTPRGEGTMNRHRTLSAATMAALGISTASHAYIVFDQFGDLSTIGERANPCQRFPDSPAFDIASLDDFTLSGGVGALTSVETLVVGANGFTSTGNVQAWSVEIYSSVANAATDLPPLLSPQFTQ